MVATLFHLSKLLIAGANGTGKMGEPLSLPIIAGPNQCYSQTFMSIGAFDTKEEAINCLSYIKTKFARFLLGTLKITQNNPRETWAHIPLLAFTNCKGINWNINEIQELDNQLFKLYNFTEEEINYISENVQEMK